MEGGSETSLWKRGDFRKRKEKAFLRDRDRNHKAKVLTVLSELRAVVDRKEDGLGWKSKSEEKKRDFSVSLK